MQRCTRKIRRRANALRAAARGALRGTQRHLHVHPLPALDLHERRAREKLQLETARLLSVLGAASADASTAARAMSALTSAQQESILQMIADSTSSGRLASGWEQMKKSSLGTNWRTFSRSRLRRWGQTSKIAAGRWLIQRARITWVARSAPRGSCSRKRWELRLSRRRPWVGPRTTRCWRRTIAFPASAEGAAPPLGSLRYTSVGGSHTNVFLRCVIARSPTSVKAIADARGYIDSERLQACQPELAEACSKGLTWLVIKFNVASITGMKSFVQRALNADVREAVHETEIIRIGCSRSA